MTALTCPLCGAPLPAPGAGELARCSYCNTTSRLSGGTAAVASRGTADPAQTEERNQRIERLNELYRAVLVLQLDSPRTSR